MAMSFLPYFVAKFVVGMFSGVLLEQFCPAEGPRHSNLLWLEIALMTLIGPLALLGFRQQIRCAKKVAIITKKHP